MHGNFLPEITQKAKKFANRIHGRYGIKVVMHDERLTTVEAKSNIYQHHGFKKLDKDNIDNINLELSSFCNKLFENNKISTNLKVSTVWLFIDLTKSH